VVHSSYRFPGEQTLYSVPESSVRRADVGPLRRKTIVKRRHREQGKWKVVLCSRTAFINGRSERFPRPLSETRLPLPASLSTGVRVAHGFQSNQSAPARFRPPRPIISRREGSSPIQHRRTSSDRRGWPARSRDRRSEWRARCHDHARSVRAVDAISRSDVLARWTKAQRSCTLLFLKVSPSDPATIRWPLQSSGS
jgi:hypothetical protein